MSGVDYKLSNRQEAYAQARAQGFQRTESALRAGYSKSSARSMASKLESSPKVVSRIRELKEQFGATSEYSSEQIRAREAEVERRRLSAEADARSQLYKIEEWRRDNVAIATSDIRALFNGDGTLKAMTDLPPEVAASVSSVKTKELFDRDKDGNEILIGYTREVKFWDKGQALDRLGKHIGAYEVDNRQKNPDLGIGHLSEEQQAQLGLFLREKMGFDVAGHLIEGEYSEIAPPTFEHDEDSE